MARYQGHRNWNHWNVNLWINNDEHFYSLARDYCRSNTSRDAAARQFVQDLASVGVTHTPDGAPYTVTTVRAAMRGM